MWVRAHAVMFLDDAPLTMLVADKPIPPAYTSRTSTSSSRADDVDTLAVAGWNLVKPSGSASGTCGAAPCSASPTLACVYVCGDVRQSSNAIRYRFSHES